MEDIPEHNLSGGVESDPTVEVRKRKEREPVGLKSQEIQTKQEINKEKNVTGKRPVPTPRRKSRTLRPGSVRVPGQRKGIRRYSSLDKLAYGDPWVPRVPRKRPSLSGGSNTGRYPRRPSYMRAVGARRRSSVGTPRRNALIGSIPRVGARKREKLSEGKKSSSIDSSPVTISGPILISVTKPFSPALLELAEQGKPKSPKCTTKLRPPYSKSTGSSPVGSPVISAPTLVSMAKNLPFSAALIGLEAGDDRNLISSGSPTISRPTLISTTKNSPFSALTGFETKDKPITPETQRSIEKIRQTFSQYFSKTGSPPVERKFLQKGNFSPTTTASKLLSSTPPDGKPVIWNTQEACVWCNMSSQRVELTEVDLLSLSETECISLQKVAEQRLREIDLGASITIPKDESKLNRGKHNSSWRGVHLPLVAKNKSKKEPDRVFAIPLFRVVENDQLLRLQTVEQDDAFYGDGLSGNDDEAHSSLEASPKPQRRMSSSQDSSTEHSGASVLSTADYNDHPSTPPNDSPVNRRRMPGGRTLRRRGGEYAGIDPEQTKLLESLMMTGSSKQTSKQSLLPPTMPQVPYVVQKCCAHILKHGLDITGIFRIAGSKKRVKQLREEFDHGVDVRIDEDYHAHDVAALLKEFFRDLPEALLTRELYSAFISTAKLSGPQRLSALRCLVWLLPMPHRDTLQELVSFLATVAEHSEDRIDTNGKQICGNKMSVANLSVIFGPNILHRDKRTSQSSSDTQYQVQSIERAEESSFVIKIVDDMIRMQRELFLIPPETHDQILRTLQESDPDAVDFLLRRKAANYMKNTGCRTPNSVDGDSPTDTKSKLLPSTADIDTDHNDENNNKNNNGYPKSAITPDKEQHRTKAVDIPVRKEPRRKISEELESSFSLSPRSKLASISFTDEDLEDILHADTTSTSKPITPTPTDEKLTLNGNASPLEGSELPKPRPRQIKLIPDPAPVQYSRRQAFSIDPPREHAHHDQQKHTQTKQSPIPAHRSRKPKHDSENFTTGVQNRNRPINPIRENGSGVVNEVSSWSYVGTYYDDTNTVAARYHPKAADASDKESRPDPEFPSVEKTIRKPLPNALNLRVNRTHGNVVSFHTARIPKNFPGKRVDKDAANSQRIPEYGAGRRVSKDDMYLTLQEFRRRNVERQNIL